MKLKLITTASNPEHPGWLQFKRSLDHFGWDYHLIVHTYTNYNDKIIAFYKYLTEHRGEFTHFVYADSYDSFALAPQSELENKYTEHEKIIYGIEKACWPHPEWSKDFPETPYPYKHLNGGGFIGSIENFIRLYEANPIVQSGAMNDQVWAQEYFLKRNDGTIQLDRASEIFQCTAHSDENDFEIVNIKGQNRIVNVHSMALPIIFHFNGHSDGTWVRNLLP